MLDFTSAHYLDIRHGWHELRPWPQLTTGRPAALFELRASEAAARRLADLQGCERATLGTSTLHVFFDLFGLWAKKGVTIYVDEGAYAIGRWGTQWAGRGGAKLQSLSHFDPSALTPGSRGVAPERESRVVLVDGLCTRCGRLAPLARYIDVLHPLRDYLVVDDTQAIGIAGTDPSPSAPYGRAGGGSLRWWSLRVQNVVVVSSLAKAFGAPIAALSGSAKLVTRFEEQSATRVHCSPPSNAAVSALDRALDVNARDGDERRGHLFRLVQMFHRLAKSLGLQSRGDPFPVASLIFRRGFPVAKLYERLLDAGIRPVLHAATDAGRQPLGFLITVRHQPSDIRRALLTTAKFAAEFENKRKGGLKQCAPSWTGLNNLRTG